MAGACEFPADFDIDRYEIYGEGAGCQLSDGDIISLGGRRVSVLHTPGHSLGHLCFWEPERGYLFSGDLIYAGMLDMLYPTQAPMRFCIPPHGWRLCLCGVSFPAILALLCPRRLSIKCGLPWNP